MERWAVGVGKGGAAKTTSAVAIAAALASRGRRVLVLDLDGQAHASWLLTAGRGADGLTMADVLLRRAPAEDAIRPSAVPGVDLLPATAELGGVAVQLAQELSRDVRLRSAMAEVGGYDLAIADTPPTFGPLLANALVWAGKVLTPVDCSVLALLGLVELESLIAEVRDAYNPGLSLGGILLTKVGRANIHRDVEEQLRARFGGLVYKSTIPASVKVEEAASHAQPIVTFSPKSPPAVAYLAVAEEMDHGRVVEARGRGSSGGRARKCPAA